MKFNFTKEWCIAMAKLDDGEDCRAGTHFTQGEIIASMLKAAYQEGWQNAIDSEFVGDEAQNDRFNQSDTLALCVSFDAGEYDTHPAPDDQQAKDAARYREALHQISLCSQNSMSGKQECGRIARAALSTTKQGEVLPWSKEDHEAAVRRMYLQEDQP